MPGTLSRGQVGLRADSFAEPVIHPSAFTQAYTTVRMLGSLRLLTHPSATKQARIVKYLFAGLPSPTSKEKPYREAVVGRMRSNGLDLTLHEYLQPATAKEKSYGYKAIVAVRANIVGPRISPKDPLHPPIPIAGLVPSYEWQFVVSGADGLVPPDELVAPKGLARQIASSNEGKLVNLTDALVRTGSRRYPHDAAAILSRIRSDPHARRAIRINAELNTIMLDCAEGHPGEAVKVLRGLRHLDLGSLSPTWEYVVKVQAPALIALDRKAAE